MKPGSYNSLFLAIFLVNDVLAVRNKPAIAKSPRPTVKIENLSQGALKLSPSIASSEPERNPQDGHHTTTELNFEGEFYHSTETTLPSVSVGQLLTFFQNPEHRDFLLKGGGKPTEPVPATPGLYEEWKNQARIVESAAPDDVKDPILAIHSTVSLLPGLSIQAVSYTGCKLLQHPVTSLPMYEFTLIKEEYSPKGAKPMRWIFNKIAGNQGDDTATLTESRKTHGLARITMEPDAKTGGIRLCYFGRVKVSCSIPRRLLNTLPLSKRKVEAKVSKSIVKQLEREGLQSVQKFWTALENWRSDEDSFSS
jgi:hypothetical protein